MDPSPSDTPPVSHRVHPPTNSSHFVQISSTTSPWRFLLVWISSWTAHNRPGVRWAPNGSRFRTKVPLHNFGSPHILKGLMQTILMRGRTLAMAIAWGDWNGGFLWSGSTWPGMVNGRASPRPRRMFVVAWASGVRPGHPTTIPIAGPHLPLSRIRLFYVSLFVSIRFELCRFTFFGLWTFLPKKWNVQILLFSRENVFIRNGKGVYGSSTVKCFNFLSHVCL
jgi:hypothetical protein